MGTILVTGATGYIGGRLVPALLDAGHRVRCLARSPGKLRDVPWADAVEVVRGDIGDPDAVSTAMDGCDVAYFLVHSMGGDHDFAARDRHNADVFADCAAASSTMRRIVYLGGLGDDDDDQLSPHLSSRHEVGRILASGSVAVTEVRAAVIIGSGSASFEMLRNLVEVLPVMVTPRWVDTRVQPIAIRDVLHALLSALDRSTEGHEIAEIGGPDVLTYREMMHLYAEVAGLRRRRIVPVPVLTPSLSSHWVGLVTPLPNDLARPLVESLVNEVVVADDSVDLFGDQPRLGFRRSIELALRRIEDMDVRTRWSDAEFLGSMPADPLPSDPDWSGGTVLDDVQVRTAAAPPSAVYSVVTGVGGDRGWFVADRLWTLRGLADKLVGGPGMRRGRRDPDRLRVGDSLDFWRVEALEPDRLVRLRAEMRLPGDAWLEWRIEPHDGEGRGCDLTQRAIFVPRGLLGRLYWYVLVPFHHLIFGQLTEAMVERAERRTAATPVG